MQPDDTRIADAPSAEAGPVKGVGPIESGMGSDSRWETGPDPLASPMGGGAESAGWSARVQASIDALTHDQPHWQVLAGDLAHLLALAQPYIQASNRSYGQWLTDASSQALARYHEAIAQHTEPAKPVLAQTARDRIAELGHTIKDLRSCADNAAAERDKLIVLCGPANEVCRGAGRE